MSTVTVNPVNEVMPRSLEEAQQLIREIEVLDAQAKAKKEALKKYFNNTPSIRYVNGDNTQYTYAKVERKHVDASNVVDVLKLIAMNGGNPYEYVNIDVTRIIKDDIVTEKVMDEFVEKTYSKRLTSKKLSK